MKILKKHIHHFISISNNCNTIYTIADSNYQLVGNCNPILINLFFV